MDNENAACFCGWFFPENSVACPCAACKGNGAFSAKNAEQLMLCAFYGFGLLQKRNRIGERLACCTAQRLHFRRRLDEVRHQEHGKAAGCAGKQTVA